MKDCALLNNWQMKHEKCGLICIVSAPIYWKLHRIVAGQVILVLYQIKMI